MKTLTFAILGTLFPLLFARVQSTMPSPAEIADAHRWAAAKFAGRIEEPKPEPAIVVIANHDPVWKNGRGPRPMHIVDKEYTRGLYCHAFSKIIVRLPSPGARFSAVVGVDTNEQTSGGRGSVDFSVSVGSAEKFRSGVMREGMAGKPAAVDLGGATEFILQVDETPDGITCDQADWADAKVTLADGRELWLADLPLQEGGERAPLTTDLPFGFTYDGKPSAERLKTWKLERNSKSGEGSPPRSDERSHGTTEHTLTWTVEH